MSYSTKQRRSFFCRRNPESEKPGSGISTTRLIALSFMAAILVGAFLLTLPFSSADGSFTAPVDALFTATTSICVTGLVTVTTATHWSMAGKLIILLLIQLGGLGVITVITMLFLVMGRRITLKERMLISDAYNLGELKGMVSLVRSIVRGTVLAEGLGTLLYAAVFIPEYGWKKGIFYGIFHAVSAFCNAGIDILGEDSLISYVDNPLLNLTTMLLIISGGLGFPVWRNLLDGLREKRAKHYSFCKMFEKLTLHSRVVLTATGVLILFPAVLFFLFEYGNPATLGALSTGGKIQAALFQSVTARTAGFASIDQGQLTNASLLLTIILMFIGGSPAGTAGGMKTTTIVILLATVLGMARGGNSASVYHRRLSEDNVRSALCVVMLGLGTVITASMCLMAVEDASFADILYEVVSALGTAGLSRGITAELSVFSKLVLIVTMYIGRIGPITMVIAILHRSRRKQIRYELPEGRLIVG